MFTYFEYIIIFIPVVLAVYFYLNSRGLHKPANYFLIAASLLFYGLWKPISLPLLLLSILVNFFTGKAINAAGKGTIWKKLILAAGLSFNIGMLGYFKYTNFFIQNVNLVTGSNIGTMKILLPLGISFYTFLQISFIVDCYRGKIAAIDPEKYLLFVTFFPKLLQGPITYHEEMRVQFDRPGIRTVNYENIARGLLLLGIGLVKKLVLADNLGVWVNIGFDKAPTLDFFEAWFVALAFIFQVYFDFSGYTDIAIGIARMFNITLPINFDSPYKAVNIQDLWRRWHITFMRFMRDYVYFSLGGSRKGEARLYLNLIITFTIGGFWHGAGWGYILWGALNGVALIVHRIWKKTGVVMNAHLARFITIMFFTFSGMYFRPTPLKVTTKVHMGMLGLNGFVLPWNLQVLFGGKPGIWLLHLGPKDYQYIYLILISIVIIFFMKNSNEIVKKMKPSAIWALFVGLLLGVGILHLTQVSEFIYANF
jgi:alginate O-acetyltransferase complex protein AlgI